jgi:hypothetical protein
MLLTKIVSSLIILTSFSFANAQTPAPASKNLAGFIDPVSGEGKNAFIIGWACVIGKETPAQIEIYLGGPEGKGTKASGKFFTSIASGAPINTACKTSVSSKHRFKIPVSEVTKSKTRQTIFAYVVSGTEKFLLGGSGTVKTPCE